MRRFREAEVELCEDQYRGCPLPQQRALQQKFRDALVHILPTLPEAQEQLDQLLGNDVPLGVLTDVISYMLDIDLARKQSLLAEVDVYRRAELLLADLWKPPRSFPPSSGRRLLSAPVQHELRRSAFHIRRRFSANCPYCGLKLLRLPT